MLPADMHIVVVMLENRSFDSFLGYLYSPNDLPQKNIPPLKPNEPPFHGLNFIETKKFTNTLVVNGQTLISQPPVPSVRATNSPGSDPGEEYEHVNMQLFGSSVPPSQDKKPTPTMTGFLQDYGNQLLNKATLETISQIMHMYTPADLPVLNSLARAYAVSDMWFASVPTQTNANRAFSICGTSMGLVDNGFLSPNWVEALLADDRFDADTIWHVLERHNFHGWAVFWSEKYPPVISNVPYTRRVFPRLEHIENIDSHFHQMDDFYTMAEAGTLPAFSYIEPKWGGEILRVSVMGSEYHPPEDVTPAEHTLRKIYTSLAKNQAAWQKTLLVIYFDEHGGTFDHVHPLWGASPPWGSGAPTRLPKGLQHNFQFDRFGVRVPAILVSPHIAAGTVLRSPTATPYDHTSVIATVLKWLLPNVPHAEWGLGERVANAPTFENVLTLQAPRMDNIFAPQTPPTAGTQLNYGDPFYLKHADGKRVTGAHSGLLYYYPTLSAGAPVMLDFRSGWGPVNSGAIVQIRTDEFLKPDSSIEPMFAGIRNFLGAWKDQHDCYYYSSDDSKNYGQQYWTVTRADGSGGSIRYGDSVVITSNFDDFKGQRLAKDGGFITTAANAPDIWVIEPADNPHARVRNYSSL